MMIKKTAIRPQRYFSEELKKDIVKEIESGKMRVSQIVREYSVAQQTIYNWIYKYSRTLKKGVRVVMEKESHEKSTETLRKHIKDLEAALGRKSLEAELYRVIVEQASKEYKVDLKKSFGEAASGPSGK